MNYEYIRTLPNGSQQYKITLNTFRDALNSQINFADELQLGVYLNNDDKDRYDIKTFKLVTQFEVPAPGDIDCDFYEEQVKIFYGFYEQIITLPPNPSGYHLTFVQCCRNQQRNIIPDLGQDPTQGQTYYCFIPSTSFENSSPAYYGVPSPYMCARDTTSFLFDAIDKDGDSLVYSIMRPFGGGSAGNSAPVPEDQLTLKPLIYQPGYDELEPFGAGGYISVDPSTGRTLMYAPEAGRYVVGVQVTEYRNGIELSTVRMDLQIDVLNCIPNNPPNISSDKGKRFEIEEGEELCFNVKAEDPDGDIVKISGRGVILGDGDTTGISQGTFTDAAGIGEVTSEFCWTPGCDMARDNPYFVYFTVEDNGCPPKFNHLDVEIKVTPFQGAENLIGPTTICRYNEYEYTVTDGNSTSSYEWDISQGVIVGPDSDSSIIVDWEGSGIGTVRVREVTNAGCLGEWLELDVNIIESPDLPVIEGIDTICEDNLPITYRVTENPNNTFNWIVENATTGTIDRNEIELVGFRIPSFTLRVVEINDVGCPSDTAVIEVWVSTPLPTITGPQVVCPNAEGMVYRVDSPWQNSTYDWTITGGTQTSGGNSSSITVDWGNEGLGSINVVETDKFGCVSPEVTLDVDKTYDLGELDLLGPINVCEFDQGVEYEVGASNGSIFRWTISGGAQQSGDSSQAITVDWGPTGLGEVSVFQFAFDDVNNRECIGQETTIDVNIHPLPIADEILGPMDVCQSEDSVEYTINGYVNSTFDWSVNGNSENIVGQGTNTIKVAWNSAGTFNISVLEITEFDCINQVIDTQVIVRPKPTTSAIQGEVIICPENAINMNYSVIGFANSTFNWTVDSAEDVRNNGASTIEVDWDTDRSSGRVSVVEISEYGCIGDTQTVDVFFDNLEIDLRFVSVGTPDDRIEIEWELVRPASASSFNISRRTAGSTGEYQNITTVAGTEFNYTELGINTDISAYEYRVSSLNQCGTTVLSEPHTTILLEATKDVELNSEVLFSEYFGWENGVANYDLFSNDNTTPYYVIETSAQPNSPYLFVFEPEKFRKCYRAFAEEDRGDNTTSWSNEVCLFFSPQVLVPNAFTPNGDGLNDGFGVRGIAVNEFNIKIYNRWGEQIYESEDINAKWQPIYQNRQVQQGTYMYLITFTDGEDNVYTKSGTINLIR